jgi:hypothetical protein
MQAIFKGGKDKTIFIMPLALMPNSFSCPMAHFHRKKV